MKITHLPVPQSFFTGVGLIALMAVLLIPPQAALAGGVKTIRISATIPAIPGVNVPLLREEIFGDERASQEGNLVKAIIEVPELIQQKITSGNKIRYTYCAK